MATSIRSRHLLRKLCSWLKNKSVGARLAPEPCQFVKNAAPILFLDNTFAFGGAINSLSCLIGALDRACFTPVLVTGQSEGFLAKLFDCRTHRYIPKLPWVDNKAYKKIAGLPLFRSRFSRKVLTLCRLLFWHACIYPLGAFRYYRLGRQHKVALVHLNNMPSSQFAGILAAKLLRVPCVAHLRDFEHINPVTRLYVRFIDHHVAISGAIRDNLRQLGVPAERITIIHNALDLKQFQPTLESDSLRAEFGLTYEQPAFGLFGRVVEWKGVREFIHAVRQVVDGNPSAVGFVVGGAVQGEEDFYRDMQSLAVELGLADNIIFTGYRSDVNALMGVMDVVVHASIRPEPFGRVIIEGMAMEKPVVATRGGGALDIVVEGECGVLVEMGDAAALGCAIGTLLEQPELRAKMGAAGRARVEKYFDSHKYSSQMASVYQRLVGETSLENNRVSRGAEIKREFFK